MVVGAFHLDHEGVAQHMTDGARLDIGALRRRPVPRRSFQYSNRSRLDGCFILRPRLSCLRSGPCPIGHDGRALTCLQGIEQGVCRGRVWRALAARRSALALSSSRCWLTAAPA